MLLKSKDFKKSTLKCTYSYVAIIQLKTDYSGERKVVTVHGAERESEKITIKTFKTSNAVEILHTSLFQTISQRIGQEYPNALNINLTVDIKNTTILEEEFIKF